MLFCMSFFHAKVDAEVKDSQIKIDGKIFHVFSKQLMHDFTIREGFIE